MDIHIDMQGYPVVLQWICVEHKYSLMDIHVFLDVFSTIHAFIDIHLDIHGFLWISMHGLDIDSRFRRVEGYR